MIDLQKPIRTKDGREAKYLGNSLAGHHVFEIVLKQACRPEDLEKQFENIPPAPSKLTGYCYVCENQVFGTFATPQEAARNIDASYVLDLSTLTEKNFVRVGL